MLKVLANLKIIGGESSRELSSFSYAFAGSYPMTTPAALFAFGVIASVLALVALRFVPRSSPTERSNF